MKTTAALGGVIVLVLAAIAPVVAQQSGMPPAPGAQPQPPSGAQAQPGHGGQTPGGGPGTHGGMHGGMTSGMCPMMGSMMQGGTMGAMPMMGGQAESPRVMQMRGEMLKAMGEVLVKYGKMMETPSR
jgi:hypothetical protein